jgi:outer membrane protein assembly factor BamB
MRVDGRAGGIGALFFRTRQRFDCTGLVQAGVLYVGGEDGFVRAIDLTGGKGKNRWRMGDDRGKTEWFVNSAPARSPTGTLIVAGRDEYLNAFDAEGQAVAKLHIRGQMLGSPVIDSSGDIYVGVSLLERGHEARGKLVCVSHDVRQVRWEYSADGAVESTAVLGDDGTIYFGDNAGMVHAVRSDGRGAWKEPVGPAVRSVGCILSTGRVVFGLDDGTLVALTSTSKTLASGGWPKYLASPANRTE